MRKKKKTPRLIVQNKSKRQKLPVKYALTSG